MSTRIADIICIAQITFKIIHSALLVYNGRLLFLHFNCVFDLSAGVNRTDLGVYLSAEITKGAFFYPQFWNKNGWYGMLGIIRIV